MGDAPVVETGRERSFLSNLFALYLSPGEAFASILKRPSFWLPFTVFLSLNVAFAAVWLRRVDPAEFIRVQLEDFGMWDKIPLEQRAAAVERGARGFSFAVLRNATLIPIVITLIIAAVLLFVFRFLYAGDLTFKRSMALVVYSLLAVALVQTPLTLLAMLLKGEWNVDPQTALQANPTLFAAKESVAAPLYSLLGSLDLFSFWTITLLAVGFGMAVRRPAVYAVWGVVTPWAVYVAGKVAVGALIRTLMGA